MSSETRPGNKEIPYRLLFCAPHRSIAVLHHSVKLAHGAAEEQRR